ncbi:hypothetical protein F4806DRAFT_447059 [Annulohypoxylon nitens]|nr:hypothetical protein F4806DRAFT_447059 [Annulohypoxylon nitens]
MTVWVCVLLASIDRIEEVGMGIGIIIVVPFMTMGSVLFAPAGPMGRVSGESLEVMLPIAVMLPMSVPFTDSGCHIPVVVVL